MCNPALFALLGIAVQQVGKDKAAGAQLNELGHEDARQIGFRDKARKNLMRLVQTGAQQREQDAGAARELNQTFDQAAQRGILRFSGAAAPGSAGSVTDAVAPQVAQEGALAARVAAPGIRRGRRRMTIADMGADNAITNDQATASARMLPLRMDLAAARYHDLVQAGQLLSLGGAGAQQSRMWSRPRQASAAMATDDQGYPIGDFSGRGATYVDPYSGAQTAYT